MTPTLHNDCERIAAVARRTRPAHDAAVEKLRQDKLQTARKLKAMNLTTDQIADATGLSAAEIARLSLPLGLESAPRSPR